MTPGDLKVVLLALAFAEAMTLVAVLVYARERRWWKARAVEAETERDELSADFRLVTDTLYRLYSSRLVRRFSARAN